MVVVKPYRPLNRAQHIMGIIGLKGVAVATSLPRSLMELQASGLPDNGMVP